MKQLITWCIIPLLAILLTGCGGDEPTTSGGTLIEKGLSGDTYMNTKFGVRITGLPTEGWTIEDFGVDGQGLLEAGSQGYIPLYHLLLLEPVPEEEFVTLNATESVGPVLDSGIPFIWVALDYAEGWEFQTTDLSDNLNSYAALHGAEIESKQFESIGDATAIQAVLNRGEWKEALTWFAKGEIIVRCEYIAGNDDFDKYYIRYAQLVQNVELMGS